MYISICIVSHIYSYVICSYSCPSHACALAHNETEKESYSVALFLDSKHEPETSLYLNGPFKSDPHFLGLAAVVACRCFVRMNFVHVGFARRNPKNSPVFQTCSALGHLYCQAEHIPVKQFR